MFQTLSFLFLQLLFGITSVSSSGCLLCLSGCTKRKKTAVVPIGKELSFFDGCMDIKFGTPETPKSVMCSEMASHGYHLETQDIKSIPDYDEGILWFNVNANLMQQNETKKNVNSILATVYAFDITHTLHFLAHYLPLKNSTNNNQFQLVFDYYSQFQNGIKAVDLQVWFAQFEPMRTRLLNLWNIITKPLSDSDIPNHVTEFNRSFSLTSMYIHRMSARKHGTQSKSRKPKPTHNKEYFWNSKWVNYDAEPRDFSGPGEMKDFVETILSTLVVYVDRIKSIFLDHDDKPGDVHSVYDMIRSRKVLDILYKNMFGNAIESVQIRKNVKLIKRMLWGDDSKRKLMMRLRTTYAPSILKFVVANAGKKPNIELCPKWIPAHANKTNTFRCQISWDSYVFFGNVSEDMALYETINQYITFYQIWLEWLKIPISRM